MLVARCTGKVVAGRNPRLLPETGFAVPCSLVNFSDCNKKVKVFVGFKKRK